MQRRGFYNVIKTDVKRNICVKIVVCSTATEIVINAGRKQCKAHLQVLKMHFADSLTKVRQSLTTPKLISQDDSSKNLNEILNSLIMTTVEKVKGVLRDLVVSLNTETNVFRFKSQIVGFHTN